jgi:hypothetical protein
MERLCTCLVLVAALAAGRSDAQLKMGESTTVGFATVDEAKELLGSRDDFVQCMSPFDRAARLKTDSDVSEKQYLEFVGRNVLAWDDAEKQKIVAAWQPLQTQLEALSLPFPRKVLLVKTTGNEEGGAPYTRANAVVLPEGELGKPAASIRKTICHELFHVLSRANPELREKLYASIGFVKCDEAELPPELRSRKITNPDAPRNDHCIRLRVEGSDRWAVPILFSSAEKYDVRRGGEFFDYLQFRFLLVQRSDGSAAARPTGDGRKTRLVGMDEVGGFFEQVGRNTGYVIHPEEILADNFAHLVLRQRSLPSPEVVQRLEAILKRNAVGRGAGPAGDPRERDRRQEARRSAVRQTGAS